MKETRYCSRKMKNYIPLGRLISDILTESQLIDSSTDDQFSKGMQLLDGRMLNAKGLKNMGIITDVISPHGEFPRKSPTTKGSF